MTTTRRATAFPYRKIADALHDYMQFRAHQEGVGYELSSELFETLMRRGVYVFFGVECDESGLLSDSQQPAIFREWQKYGRKAKEA
jgi:hypothetical protein